MYGSIVLMCNTRILLSPPPSVQALDGIIHFTSESKEKVRLLIWAIFIKS